MIDIHMHLIFGVDDGAVDFNMAKDMLSLAYEQGIRHILATPHSSAFSNAELVREHFDLLKHYAAKEFPSMSLCLGCEVLMCRETVDSVLKLIENGTIPTMNGTRLVLVEFYPYVQFDEMIYVLARVHKQGFLPIVAHAERYLSVFSDFLYAKAIRDSGTLIQINAFSLENEGNPKIKSIARKLLDEKAVDFLGSDSHRLNHRPPKVKDGIQYILSHCDFEYAQAVLQGNARHFFNL